MEYCFISKEGQCNSRVQWQKWLRTLKWNEMAEIRGTEMTEDRYYRKTCGDGAKLSSCPSMLTLRVLSVKYGSLRCTMDGSIGAWVSLESMSLYLILPKALFMSNKTAPMDWCLLVVSASWEVTLTSCRVVICPWWNWTYSSQMVYLPEAGYGPTEVAWIPLKLLAKVIQDDSFLEYHFLYFRVVTRTLLNNWACPSP